MQTSLERRISLEEKICRKHITVMRALIPEIMRHDGEDAKNIDEIMDTAFRNAEIEDDAYRIHAYPNTDPHFYGTVSIHLYTFVVSWCDPDSNYVPEQTVYLHVPDVLDRKTGDMSLRANRITAALEEKIAELEERIELLRTLPSRQQETFEKMIAIRDKVLFFQQEQNPVILDFLKTGFECKENEGFLSVRMDAETVEFPFESNEKIMAMATETAACYKLHLQALETMLPAIAAFDGKATVFKFRDAMKNKVEPCIPSYDLDIEFQAKETVIELTAWKHLLPGDWKNSPHNVCIRKGIRGAIKTVTKTITASKPAKKTSTRRIIQAGALTAAVEEWIREIKERIAVCERLAADEEYASSVRDTWTAFTDFRKEIRAMNSHSVYAEIMLIGQKYEYSDLEKTIDIDIPVSSRTE